MYGFYKFAAGDEYRIVVAEAPLISYVAGLLGAQTTVSVVGIAELLLALLMLPGFGRLWSVLFQAFALGSFLFALGYPFSYPQDLGLIGVIGAFACLQTISLPLSLRRAQAGVLPRVALDQRGFAPALSLVGAVIVVRLAGATASTLEHLGAMVRGAVRPGDLLAPSGADGYCVPARRHRFAPGARSGAVPRAARAGAAGGRAGRRGLGALVDRDAAGPGYAARSGRRVVPRRRRVCAAGGLTGDHSMHGIIFSELKKYVETTYGAATWPALVQESGVGAKLYMNVQSYPGPGRGGAGHDCGA